MMLKNLFLVLLLAAASAAFTRRRPKVATFGQPGPKPPAHPQTELGRLLAKGRAYWQEVRKRDPDYEPYYEGLPVPPHLRGYDWDRDGYLNSVDLQLGGILFMFRAADKNEDNYITKEEFTSVKRQHGVPLPIYKIKHFNQY